MIVLYHCAGSGVSVLSLCSQYRRGSVMVVRWQWLVSVTSAATGTSWLVALASCSCRHSSFKLVLPLQHRVSRQVCTQPQLHCITALHSLTFFHTTWLPPTVSHCLPLAPTASHWHPLSPTGTQCLSLSLSVSHCRLVPHGCLTPTHSGVLMTSARSLPPSATPSHSLPFNSAL